MERALWAQGIRTKLKEGKKRHEFQVDHGYRKFFKTRCELGGMKPINIEKLLSHSIGISDSYYRATEQELLDDYLKAMDSLTIDERNKLKKRIDKLEEKNEDEKYIIKAKLQEKEEKIQKLEQKYENDMKMLREDMTNQLSEMMLMIQQNPKLSYIKPEILEKITDN